MPLGIILVIALVAFAVGAFLIGRTVIAQRRLLKANAAGPRCGNCSYDLTGLDSNRCPECGKLFIEAGVILPNGPAEARRVRAAVIRSIILLLVMAGLTGALAVLAAHTVVRAQRAAAAQARAAALQAQAAAAASLPAQQLAASQPAASAPSDD